MYRLSRRKYVRKKSCLVFLFERTHITFITSEKKERRQRQQQRQMTFWVFRNMCNNMCKFTWSEKMTFSLLCLYYYHLQGSFLLVWILLCFLSQFPFYKGSDRKKVKWKEREGGSEGTYQRDNNQQRERWWWRWCCCFDDVNVAFFRMEEG